MDNQTHPTFGNGKICYIELPSRDINESSNFYSKVFGWEIRIRSDGSVAFDDAVNEVSGTWRTDRKPLTELGLLVHIMVDNIEAAIKAVNDNGGKIVQPVGMEAPEITARFSDSAGNVLGLFQQ
ncbi:MAG: VOC family protein [Segetibacter sp.]